MKKSLALVLALMMILSMFTMGITVSAADMPAGAIAINSVDGLKAMEAGKYYYLTADITIGTPAVLEEIGGSTTHDDGNGKQVQNDALEPAEEADLITIPAGATLDGNGYTIYNGYYVTNPGWYANNNKFAHSLAWTHEMFALSAGDTITLKNLKIGSTAQPVYLSTTNAKDDAGAIASGYTTNDTFGIFVDAEGATVNWDNVNFYVERYGRGLGSYNIGCVIFAPKGTHTFTNSSMNISVMSAGSQYGAWFYAPTNTSTLTFTNCTNKGFSIDAGYDEILDEETGAVIGQSPITWNGECWGSVGAGFIHTAKGSVSMTNCINNLEIGATYSGNGYKFAGFVAEILGSDTRAVDLYVSACVNNGDFSLNNITIGGGIVGRWNGNVASWKILNSINNGDIKRTNSAGMTSNHGFGGIAGHTGANTTYEISGCTNYGNIQGAGNIGGIVGFFEGAASVYTIKDCANYGDITSVDNVEAGGIVGQARFNVNISNCKNFGTIAAKANNGGILGAGWTADTTKTISNCINYGTIGNTSLTHAGGIVGITKTHKMTYNLNNCINYGKILTRQYAGGMVGEINTATIMNITGCQNHGDIGGVHAVGGFIGHTGNSADTKITISNSLNAGAVHQSSAPGEGIGGFFGRIAGTNPTIAMNNCINTGVISGSTKASNTYGFFGDTFGQFIGLYTASAGGRYYTGTDVADASIVGGFMNWSDANAKVPTLNGCRALGTAVLADGAKSLKGWITASNDGTTVTALEASAYYYDDTVTLTAPANNGYYGVNVKISGTIMGPDHAANAPTALMATMKSMFGTDFIAGDAEKGEAIAVVATPMLRGYQMSTDGTSIRFVASINASTYTNVGFKYTVTNAGNTIVDTTSTVESIWTGLNVAGKDGTITTTSATDLGAKYVTGLTFNNIPATGVYVFTVTPVATAADGTTVYTGTSYVITVTHGAVTSVTK